MSDEQVNIAAEADAAVSVNKVKPQVEFGIYLSQARTSLGLSTRDVADRLKLHEDIIKALEASRVDVLPAAAFTQGYIKAYAKLLKISPDETMRAYDVMVPNKVASLVVASGVPAERNSHDGLIKGVSYGLVVLGLVLFIFWIQQSGFHLSGNLIEQNNTAEQSAADNVEADAAPTSIPMTEPASVHATENQPLSTPLQVASAGKPVAAENTRVDVVPLVKKPEPVSEQNPQPRTPIVVVKPTSEMVTETHPVAAGDDVIRLAATAESWAEVQDADNNRLFYSLIKTGDSQAIKGRAPFKVFLGNAPGVSVEVNNQMVDISRYIRPSKIAHVKINSKASAQFGGARESQQVIDQYIPETPGTGRVD